MSSAAERVEALKNSANEKYAAGDRKGAIAEYRNAVDAGAGSADCNQVVATVYANLSQALFEDSDLDGSATAADAALTLNPTHIKAAFSG